MSYRLTLLFSLLLLSNLSYGRLISNHSSLSSSSDLVSDGVHYDLRGPLVLRLNPSLGSDTCERTYGFMPCTTTALGNLFLLVVYGYLMFRAATFLAGGSELLLEILGPGIIGGLFLPTLGALPDALLILGHFSTLGTELEWLFKYSRMQISGHLQSLMPDKD